METYTVTIMWKPKAEDGYTVQWLSCKTKLYANNKEDARQKGIKYAIETFNAVNIESTRVQKSHR